MACCGSRPARDDKKIKALTAEVQSLKAANVAQLDVTMGAKAVSYQLPGKDPKAKPFEFKLDLVHADGSEPGLL
jgi:hypothetical protein